MLTRWADRFSRALAVAAIRALAPEPVRVVGSGVTGALATRRALGASTASANKRNDSNWGGRAPISSSSGWHNGQQDAPALTVMVHDPAAFRYLLRGSIGLAESYSAGLWDCDDLVRLLRLATRSLPGQATFASKSFLAQAANLLARARRALPTFSDEPKRGLRRGEDLEQSDIDRLNIWAHYDIGNEFFALFLDPTMTYSCGIFERPEASLEEASLAKLESICQLLALRPGDEVLEIGGGWGSFALQAAASHGCRVTTTTISQRQYELACRRVQEAGLAKSVRVLRDHYLELKGTWAKIACIEMVEAVNWRQHDRFFGTCSDLLRPGGRMALQAIVIDDRFYERAKRSKDFIKAMVFPGSTIPSLARLTSCAERAGLRVASCRHIGQHYVRTLDCWRRNFLDNLEAMESLGLKPEFLRLWDLYLAYCQAGFAEGRLDDVQLLLVKT